jgi:hypothetical protein
MKRFDIPGYAFVDNIEDYCGKSILNELILKDISGVDNSFANEPFEKITNTDWNLPEYHKRLYWNKLQVHFCDHLQKIGEYCGYKKFQIKNFWFQQYLNGDYHSWHVHDGCMFSTVYYVECTEETPVTSFKFGEYEFEIPVKEGDILTFPSFLMHQSKVNETNKRKTVISFNTNFMD